MGHFEKDTKNRSCEGFHELRRFTERTNIEWETLKYGDVSVTFELDVAVTS